jgi:hypothetical protein
MTGKRFCGLEPLSSREKKLVMKFAYVLFGVLSVHLVLVALSLAIAGHAQALLFGQWEEISGSKLVVWASLLSYCGVSGLLALVKKSERAACHALICWLLLSVFHAWHLQLLIARSSALEGDDQRSWTLCEMTVQLLTDSMSAGFLAWTLRQDGEFNFIKGDFIREPLLPTRSGTRAS